MAKSKDPRDTPMMRQYLETKAANPGCLLFMRMGDFYEVFLEDAVEAARVLGITLTSRNKGEANEVPMAGVPHHSLDGHLPKLLAAGHRVGIMDQLEDPKEAKGLVKRGLTRVITAGTLLEDELIGPGEAPALVACTALDGIVGVASLDVAGGVFTVELAPPGGLRLALARLQPAELLLPEALCEAPDIEATLTDLFEGPAPPLASLPASCWHGTDGRRQLCEHFKVGSLDGFAIGPDEDDDLLAAAAAAALRYARNSTGGTVGSELGHLRRIQRLQPSGHLILDAHCQRNLELVRNQRDGGRSDTLLAAVNRCRTAPGSRLLARWLRQPLAAVAPIIARHDAVACCLADDDLRSDLRDALDGVYDLERLMGRCATGRCNARDLVQLSGSLMRSAQVRDRLAEADLPELLALAFGDLEPEPGLAEDLAETLVDDPPLTIGEGGLLRDGVDPDLDELRSIRADAGSWLAAYQASEAEAIGLKTLKVGYNKVFGYYVELGKQHADKLPAHYVRKQTLVNAERYITPELKEYEDRVLGAEDRIRALEKDRFEALRQRVLAALPAIQAVADALSLIDVCAGLAEVARRGGWCRPVVDDSSVLDLVGARHPVVERVLGAGRFVANDCLLDADADEAPRLAVITGPNMAGKSTYIRQTALCVVLAQAGAFVPAERARIGVVDRLFTRIGAGDELARNLSTFMVEMAETAAILNNAAARSLVVLDEVGRGTSTFDGLSLAWAITEHLHDRIGCRCLFATHYHELTDLAAERGGITNLTVAVAEADDQVVFLHRIEAGAATRSYGIHVARLAGVPDPVVQRARSVQETLDELNISLGERERPSVAASPSQQVVGDPVQLTLFSAAQSPVLDRLSAAKLDDLTPRQAQDLLYELQAQARQAGT
jgi:DNA mismatch repair protein MutS